MNVQQNESTANRQVWSAQSAKWVWLDGPDKPANAYARFRRSFQLHEAPEAAKVFVTADCKYRLYVNAQHVGDGPVVTHNRLKQVDPYDVTPHLREGENVIAAVVLQRHQHCSRLYPTRGGFLLELEAGAFRLGTDASWKARWADDYDPNAVQMTIHYGNQEWVDGRKSPVGWDQPGFDDGDWGPAVEIPDAETHWPAELEVRTIPHMRRVIRHPQKVVTTLGLSAEASAYADAEPAKAMAHAYVTSSQLTSGLDNLLNPSQAPAILKGNLTIDPCMGISDGVLIVLDFGQEMIGRPFLDIECGEGVEVNIGHGEYLPNNRVRTVYRPATGGEQRYADRYITRGGRQRFELFDTKGLRYLEIHFNRLTPLDGENQVRIHEVGVAESVTPYDLASEFHCSDPLLDDIWSISRRTAVVLCQEGHICDAQREQNYYVESEHDMILLQTFGHVEMIRSCLDTFVRLQKPEGDFLPYFPLGPDRSLDEITTDELWFTAQYALPYAIYLDWLFAGRDDRQPEWLAGCDRCYDWIMSHVGPHGTIQNLPGKPFFEWCAMDLRRSCDDAHPAELAAMNGAIVFAFDRLAEVATDWGRDDLAEKWTRGNDAVRRACGERFWDDKREAYVDGVYDNIPSAIVSQTTNMWATMAKFGPPEQLAQALRTVEAPDGCDVPVVNFMEGLYHEALRLFDMDAPAIGRIREVFGAMLDHGATTVWEDPFTLEFDNAHCMAISAHGLWYLTRTALGVTPMRNAYERFTVRISPLDLTWAKGRVATPHGYIDVDWQLKDDTMQLRLTVPPETTAVVAPPRTGKLQELTRIQVNGEAVELTPHEVAANTFSREDLPACELGTGRYDIVFA